MSNTKQKNARIWMCPIISLLDELFWLSWNIFIDCSFKQQWWSLILLRTFKNTHFWGTDLFQAIHLCMHGIREVHIQIIQILSGSSIAVLNLGILNSSNNSVLTKNYLQKHLCHRTDEMENIDFRPTLTLTSISMISLPFLTLWIKNFCCDINIR